MPIATREDIGEVNLIDEKLAKKAWDYISHAEERLRKIVGHSRYEEIRDDSTEAYYDRLKRSEALLCFALALPRLGMRITSEGGLVSSTGFNESRNQLASQRQVAAWQRDLIAEAENLVWALIYGEEYEET